MTEHHPSLQKAEESSVFLPVSKKKASPYVGLDRMSMLISSIGMIRLALMNAINTQSVLDTTDCHALAAFVTLLEEDMEKVMEELYPARQK